MIKNTNKTAVIKPQTERQNTTEVAKEYKKTKENCRWCST